MIFQLPVEILINNDKLEDIKQYIIDSNETLKPPLENFIWSNDYNEIYFNTFKKDIFQQDLPESMDNYINMLI